MGRTVYLPTNFNHFQGPTKPTPNPNAPKHKVTFQGGFAMSKSWSVKIHSSNGDMAIAFVDDDSVRQNPSNREGGVENDDPKNT